MTLAAHNAIKDSLPEGKMAVGTSIQIRHFVAAPLGSKVRAEASINWLRK